MAGRGATQAREARAQARGARAQAERPAQPERPALPEALVAGRILPAMGAPWLVRGLARGFRAAAPGAVRVPVSALRGEGQMEWARACGLPVADERLAPALARAGNLDELRWARERWGSPLGPEVCSEAARNGHLAVLRWAREEAGCLWNSNTTVMAAAGGHLEVLRWARSGPDPCAWSDDAAKAAALWGHFETAMWCVENGCPVNEGVCLGAARYGRIDVLEWAWERGLPCDATACGMAAAKNQLETLQWLRSREPPVPWGDSAWNAARTGNLGVLQWVVQNGCPLQERVINVAAFQGHLEVIRFLHEERNMPLSGMLCYAAARRGDLGLMQWLRGRDSPWDSRVSREAARLGHLELLQWATGAGCPWNAHDMSIAMHQSGKREVVEWVRAQLEGA